MGLFANVPYAQAPGMGLNAFFTFTVVFGMGYTWQQALAMVFICGLINILITVTKIRKMIIKAIPESLQHAIGGGIGIFVAYVGLKNAGLLSFTVQAEPQNGVVNGSSIVPALGNFDNPAIILAVIASFNNDFSCHQCSWGYFNWHCGYYVSRNSNGGGRHCFG